LTEDDLLEVVLDAGAEESNDLAEAFEESDDVQNVWVKRRRERRDPGRARRGLRTTPLGRGRRRNDLGRLAT
jgi:hypothetical protein